MVYLTDSRTNYSSNEDASLPQTRFGIFNLVVLTRWHSKLKGVQKSLGKERCQVCKKLVKHLLVLYCWSLLSWLPVPRDVLTSIFPSHCHNLALNLRPNSAIVSLPLTNSPPRMESAKLLFPAQLFQHNNQLEVRLHSHNTSRLICLAIELLHKDRNGEFVYNKYSHTEHVKKY